MATLDKQFSLESNAIAHEHKAVVNELAALSLALDQMCRESDEFANLAAAKQVQFLVKDLTQLLPGHFLHEERTVLGTVAEVSRELAAFAQEMKRQHRDLERRFADFRVTLEQLDTVENLDSAFARIKQQGRDLVRDLERHIQAEESELSGFL